jgi:uncharacterized Tic20 family protein
MPIAVVCPKCKSKLKAPEGLIGKTVKCPKCATPVLIKAPAEDPAPARAATAKKPADDFEDFEDEPPRKAKAKKPADDDFDDLEPPAKGKDKAKAKKGADEDDFADLDDEPPRKGKAKAKGDEDEIDEIEDEDEDRPKKKGKGKGVEVPTDPVEDWEKTWGMLLHLSQFVVNFWGPLLIWLLKKKDSKFIVWHFKAWFNNALTMFLISFLLAIVFIAPGVGVMIAVDPLIGGIVMGLGGVAVACLGLLNAIFTLIAGIRAKAGVWYLYPMAKRFWK